MTLELPGGGAALIVAEVAAFGARTVETGGFLLAPVGAPRVSAVALAGTRDIQRARDLFVVGGGALAALFEWVDVHGLTIAAQFHSHRDRAFLSDTDLEHGFSVPGFITTVVPGYAAPPADPAAWGWWRFEGGTWRAVPAPAAVDGGVSVHRFDEDGVHVA